MSRRVGIALLTGLTATSVAAADLLPLKRGIYVDIHVPCKGASNADTLSYWGESNGINESKIACRIKHLSNKGAAYSLQRRCKAIDFEGRFEDSVNVIILDRQTFTISGGHRLGQPDRTLRYCGPKAQF
jgi:hypothetical protein